MAVGFAGFHRAGHRDCLAHQQEFLGDGGFTGIGVGNDGKRASGVDFIDNFTIGHRLKSRLCTLICTQLKKYLWPIAKANTENRALYQMVMGNARDSSQSGATPPSRLPVASAEPLGMLPVMRVDSMMANR